MLRAIQVIVLAVLFHPSSAKADVRRFALDYQATVSCADEPQLLAEIRRRAPHAVRVGQESAHEVRARVRVDTLDERRRGVVDVDTRDGTTHREVEGAECAEVVRALALIVAMALEPEGAPAESQPLERTPDRKAPLRATSPSKRPAVEWGAGLSVGLQGGVAPSPTLSEGLFVQIGRWRDRGFSANVRLAGLHARGSESASGGVAHFELLSLRLASCPYRVGARLQLSGCVSFDWGRLEGSGSETIAAQPSSAPWLGPGAFVDAAIELLPPLHLQLEMGAIFPLARDRFYFGPDETVHRIPAVAGYGGLNVVVSG